MKQTDSDMADKTVVFVNLDVESILSVIANNAEEKGTNFQISDCGSKASYTITQQTEGEEIVQNEIKIVEQADIKI